MIASPVKRTAHHAPLADSPGNLTIAGGLPAYAGNRTERVIKAPQIYLGDTGLAMHLAEVEAPSGVHLENLVLHDLMAWRDSRVERAELGYWRTSMGE